MQVLKRSAYDDAIAVLCHGDLLSKLVRRGEQ